MKIFGATNGKEILEREKWSGEEDIAATLFLHAISLRQYGSHELLPRVTPATGGMRHRLQPPQLRRVPFFQEKLFSYRRRVA